MNKLLVVLTLLIFLASCGKKENGRGRIPVAEVGKAVLYYDMIPPIINHEIKEQDSVALIRNYINKWAKRELLLQKAEENLSPELKEEIGRQVEETHDNLYIYQYQKQMMIEKLDTVLTDKQLEDYYSANKGSFNLNSNIVKALFIKLPEVL